MNDSIHGGLRVYQSTPLVQLQDRGRFGCRHLGVTQGGALDWPMARDRARCPCPANGSWTAPAKRAWS